MPGCRDESSICKDGRHLPIADESVTPLVFLLQLISNLVRDEDFNRQARLPVCESHEEEDRRMELITMNSG